MENTSNGGNLTINTMENNVPESFKALCRMIMKQTVTYGEAWAMVKDIVAADRGFEFRPFGNPLMPSPFDVWC